MCCYVKLYVCCYVSCYVDMPVSASRTLCFVQYSYYRALEVVVVDMDAFAEGPRLAGGYNALWHPH